MNPRLTKATSVQWKECVGNQYQFELKLEGTGKEYMLNLPQLLDFGFVKTLISMHEGWLPFFEFESLESMDQQKAAWKSQLDAAGLSDPPPIESVEQQTIKMRDYLKKNLDQD